MIVLEGLLGARIGEPAAAQIVVIGYEAEELGSLDLDRGELILVVLGKGTGCSIPGQKMRGKIMKLQKSEIKTENNRIRSPVEQNRKD